MKKFLTIATITLMFAGVLSANAQAACKYDVVGNTQLAPTIALSGDGQVTFGMAAWWEDDVYACYNAFVTPAYLFYMPGCDLDGSGLVEITEVLEMYEFVNKYPTGGVPAFAWQCPEYYDPAAVHDETSIEWTANGTCTELNGIAGPATCPQEQHDMMLGDLNYMIGTYPWTEAVFDGYHTGGQTWAHMPYSLICATDGSVVFPEGQFDNLNSCYEGQSNYLSGGAFAIIKFDWAVNVWDAVNRYDTVAKAFDPTTYCELDGIVGGAPTGFHATDMGSGWHEWTVRSTAECDMYGCGCDATLTLWSDGTQYIESSLENNSGIVRPCPDNRFNF